MLKRMLKPVALVVTIFGLLSFIAPVAEANDTIVLMKNGYPIETDTPPIIKEGRVLVPIRIVDEMLAFNVEWDGEHEAVLVNGRPSVFESDSTDIRLYINNQLVETDVAPRIVNGRILVPLRVISENMGVQVNWDASQRSVSIDMELAPFLEDTIANIESFCKRTRSA